MFRVVFFSPQAGQEIASSARLAGRSSSKVLPHFEQVYW